MAMLPFSSTRLSRRSVVGSGIAGAALLPLAAIDRDAMTGSTRAITPRQNVADELTTWNMWLLTAPEELRPAAPGPASQEEIEDVKHCGLRVVS